MNNKVFSKKMIDMYELSIEHIHIFTNEEIAYYAKYMDVVQKFLKKYPQLAF